ncbi:MAG: sulfotransferase [Campylobacterota bacterium]|nr:sulfotransferase [Campylobacterota bacterium]
MNDSNSIDFLCIGAQKSATTWLWNKLYKNKNIWMPPRKEIHYFDRNLKYPSPSFLASDNILLRLFSRKSHNVLFRKKLKEEMKYIIKTKDRNKIKWYIKYFFGFYGDNWYRSLFKEGVGKLKGEITPAYSILNVDDVKKIKILFPNLKIIFLMRNPVQRAWSQYKFYHTINKNDVDLTDYYTFLNNPIQLLRGDYLRTLNIWNSVFDKKQIFVGFYDQVIEDPDNLLYNICDFLGVKYKKENNLQQKINKSKEIKMPKEIEYYLIDKYYNDVKQLSLEYSEYPTKWLKKYDLALETKDKI